MSSSKQYTVKDFINKVASQLNLKLSWKGKGLKEKAYDKSGRVVIKISKHYFRPNDVVNLLVNQKKQRNYSDGILI